LNKRFVFVMSCTGTNVPRS